MNDILLALACLITLAGQVMTLLHFRGYRDHGPGCWVCRVLGGAVARIETLFRSLSRQPR